MPHDHIKTGPDVEVDVRITNCPECGREWERVVSVRPGGARSRSKRGPLEG